MSLLASEMRFVTGHVPLFHSPHAITIPPSHGGCLAWAVSRRGEYCPVAVTAPSYDTKNSRCPVSPFILAQVFLLVRTENRNMETSSVWKKGSWWILYYLQVFTGIIIWSENQYCICWRSCPSDFSLLFPILFPCSWFKDNSRKHKWERKNSESESGSFWWWSSTKTRICTIQGNKSNIFSLLL